MGMLELTVKLFIKQQKARDSSNASLLTIGKQRIDFSVDELEFWAKKNYFILNNVYLESAKLEKRKLTETEFFKSIGFSSVDSLDVSEYEGATIICNLNNDIPHELKNRFDVIFDGGSTEHMFNVPKAFENYNKMLKVGGDIIHSLPSTGCLDHGFYMFSPTLFYDYYSQNRWKIKDFLMIQLPYSGFKPWRIFRYSEPGPSLEGVKFFGRWTIFFIAQKQEFSSYNCNIEQHFFKPLWNQNSSEPTFLRKVFRTLPERLKSIVRSLFKIRELTSFSKQTNFKEIDLLD